MIYDGLGLGQTALDSSMWPLFFCQRLILSWACLQGGRVLQAELSRDSGGLALNWHYRFCHILSQRKWQNQFRFKGKKKKIPLFKEKDAKPYLTLYMDAGRERIGTLFSNSLSQHGQSHRCETIFLKSHTDSLCNILPLVEQISNQVNASRVRERRREGMSE